MNLDQTITISTAVTSREISGETVLLDMASERYFGLDEIGTRVWQVLAKTRSPGAAFDALLEEYDVEPERLEHDLVELLERLADAGLICCQDRQNV